MQKMINKENELRTNIETYYQMARKLRDESIDYIKIFVKQYGKLIPNKYNAYELNLWNDKVDDYFGGVSISCYYDGGNHPEYATNGSATIYAIRVINDTIELSIEDCDKYDESRVLTDDLIDLVDHLMNEVQTSIIKYQ